MPLVIGSNAEVTGLGENTAIAGNLEVTVYPNPSMTWFNLKISGSAEEVQVRIFDMTGRMMQETKGTLQESLRIGDQLAKGTFIAEVRQGSEILRVKLIKQ